MVSRAVVALIEYEQVHILQTKEPMPEQEEALLRYTHHHVCLRQVLLPVVGGGLIEVALASLVAV